MYSLQLLPGWLNVCTEEMQTFHRHFPLWEIYCRYCKVCDNNCSSCRRDQVHLVLQFTGKSSLWSSSSVPCRNVKYLHRVNYYVQQCNSIQCNNNYRLPMDFLAIAIKEITAGHSSRNRLNVNYQYFTKSPRKLSRLIIDLDQQSMETLYSSSS